MDMEYTIKIPLKILFLSLNTLKGSQHPAHPSASSSSTQLSTTAYCVNAHGEYVSAVSTLSSGCTPSMIKSIRVVFSRPGAAKPVYVFAGP
jgi:hypothetical protein